ncbi:MAG: hypothetical protein JST50_14245 [Bacteroidetes bacterium]|jgi:uncharacterized membrane protein|nr:hypothetical protein [Bacteroidota bacterium]
MNGAHYHLVLNHLPIIIPIVGILVMIGGFIFRSEVIKRTSYFIFIVAALSAIAASATGDWAEDAIKHAPGVSEKLIHAHEKATEIFSIALYLLGAFCIIALWASWKQKSYARLLPWYITAFALVVVLFSKQAGTSGGVIRHPEIRGDTTANQKNPNQNNNGD